MLPTHTKDVNRRARNKILMSSVLVKQTIYNDSETKEDVFNYIYCKVCLIIYIVKFCVTSSTSF